MLLKELLDTKVDYKVIKDSGGEYVTASEIAGRTIEVHIFDTRSKDKIFLLGFFEVDKNGDKTMRATGSGGELAVFRMVSDVVRDFIMGRKPDRIMFKADSENGKNSRSDVYERLIKKFKVPGYSFDRKENGFGSTTYFNITRDGYEAK